MIRKLTAIVCSAMVLSLLVITSEARPATILGTPSSVPPFQGGQCILPKLTVVSITYVGRESTAGVDDDKFQVIWKQSLNNSRLTFDIVKFDVSLIRENGRTDQGSTTLNRPPNTFDSNLTQFVVVPRRIGEQNVKSFSVVVTGTTTTLAGATSQKVTGNFPQGFNGSAVLPPALGLPGITITKVEDLGVLDGKRLARVNWSFTPSSDGCVTNDRTEVKVKLNGFGTSSEILNLSPSGGKRDLQTNVDVARGFTTLLQNPLPQLGGFEVTISIQQIASARTTTASGSGSF